MTVKFERKYPDIAAKRLYFNLSVIVKLHTSTLRECRFFSQTWHTAYHSDKSPWNTGPAPLRKLRVHQLWAFPLPPHSTCSPRSWGWTGCKVLRRGGWHHWLWRRCGRRPVRFPAGASWSADGKAGCWGWGSARKWRPIVYGAADTQEKTLNEKEW